MKNSVKSIQSGRSIVEMLGVLAIIGVLSIGGIAGYRSAMAQKEANDLIYTFMVDFTYIKGILMQNNSVSPYSFRYKSFFNDQTLDYYYVDMLDSNSGAVCLGQSLYVSKSVCQKLKDFNWDSLKNTFGRMEIFNTFYCNGYMDLGGTPEILLEMCLYKENEVIDL